MIGELPELPNFLNRANKTHQYQILPDLAPDDYAALKSDIGERGVMVAIEYDQDGNIIDGHHRVRACTELGIREWPRTVRTYSDDAARMRQARKLNVARRHLTTQRNVHSSRQSSRKGPPVRVQASWDKLADHGQPIRQSAPPGVIWSHVGKFPTSKSERIPRAGNNPGKTCENSRSSYRNSQH